jgi:hypothetical protein
MSISVIILLVITLVSTVGGWLFSRSNETEKAIKVLYFMLYFWLLAFVQLIVFALFYKFSGFDF